MAADPAEDIRRTMTAMINVNPGSREYLEAKHGQVWNTTELQQDFSVLGFMSPLVIVERKIDAVKGSLMFQHDPRFYHSFQPE